MARFHLGESGEARHCLETARRLMAQARPKSADAPGLLAAPDWTELNVLLREAEGLLQREADAAAPIERGAGGSKIQDGNS